MRARRKQKRNQEKEAAARIQQKLKKPKYLSNPLFLDPGEENDKPKASSKDKLSYG